MKLLGQPFVLQNTDGPDWLITSDAAVTTSQGESVSFTVAVPRRADLPVVELQRLAVLRAKELLEQWLEHQPKD